MQCHICGKEMVVTKTVMMQDNDTVQTYEQEWMCPGCDKGISRKALMWAAVAIMLISSVVAFFWALSRFYR